jgi:hypothetical protein
MATSISTGEASPSQNTEPTINSVNFGEAELSDAISKMLQKSQETEKQSDTTEEAAVAEAPESVESDQPDQQAESQDESSEDVHSQDEEAETQKQDDADEEPKGVQKRIDKLTRARKEASERAETLERELNEAKAKLEELSKQPKQVVQADPANPFSEVWEESKLTEEWQKARELKRWCEDNQDGTELNGQEYSREDIKSIRRKVEDALEVQIPRRAQFLNQYKQLKPIAEQIYPWWKDRAAVEYTQAQEVLRSMPQIANMPEYQVLIGDFVEGRKLRLAKESESKKSKTSKPLPKLAQKQPGITTTSPRRVEKSEQDTAVAKSRFFKTGGQSELAELLKRSLL